MIELLKTVPIYGGNNTYEVVEDGVCKMVVKPNIIGRSAPNNTEIMDKINEIINYINNENTNKEK